MAKPLTASMPIALDLAAGYVIRLVALNPTTGAAVGGVVIDDFTIQVEQTAGDAGALAYGPFMLVPGPNA